MTCAFSYAESRLQQLSYKSAKWGLLESGS
jgi:hypothetical protein